MDYRKETSGASEGAETDSATNATSTKKNRIKTIN